jgi:Predicted metal-dependent enzyme
MNKSSNVGGQAVMEGVMMRNGDKYAIAVRTPEKKIEVKIEECKSIIKNKKLKKMPLVRGVLNFIDSMVIGMKALTFSASFFEEEDTKESSKPKKELTEEQKQKKDKIITSITIFFSIIMAIGIFMLLPYFLSSLLRKITSSAIIIALVEGALRIIIFMGYMILISLMEDIQRVYMYHGAEHKCINCIENGFPLNIENVKKSSKHHKRCGTSFLLFVIVLSVILFMFIRIDSPLLRVFVRILLVPVIAGISYEIIRFAGRSENKIVDLISKPGMLLQHLTVKEPEEDMIEVAIVSVEAIFDWKQYQKENFEAEDRRCRE